MRIYSLAVAGVFSAVTLSDAHALVWFENFYASAITVPTSLPHNTVRDKTMGEVVYCPRRIARA